MHHLLADWLDKQNLAVRWYLPKSLLQPSVVASVLTIRNSAAECHLLQCGHLQGSKLQWYKVAVLWGVICSLSLVHNCLNLHAIQGLGEDSLGKSGKCLLYRGSDFISQDPSEKPGAIPVLGRRLVNFWGSLVIKSRRISQLVSKKNVVWLWETSSVDLFTCIRMLRKKVYCLLYFLVIFLKIIFFLTREFLFFWDGFGQMGFETSANHENRGIRVLWNLVLKLWFRSPDQMDTWRLKSQSKAFTRLVLQQLGISEDNRLLYFSTQKPL